MVFKNISHQKVNFCSLTTFLLDAFLWKLHSLKTKECTCNFPKCIPGGGTSWLKEGWSELTQ
jgi:hypothetical protein